VEVNGLTIGSSTLVDVHVVGITRRPLFGQPMKFANKPKLAYALAMALGLD
jgi:hypothetical protein